MGSIVRSFCAFSSLWDRTRVIEQIRTSQAKVLRNYMRDTREPEEGNRMKAAANWVYQVIIEVVKAATKILVEYIRKKK